MTAKPSQKSGHRHLVLIGYRGSGKTSVGKNLAKILGLDYLDTDIAIQEKAGRSVKEIFADHGEAAFRDMETEILEELVSHRGTAQPTVIATGGGMVMREHNRRLLKQLGTVIWLQVSAKTALDRILGDSFTGEQRPALTDQNLADEVRVMVSDRMPYYSACSDLMIENDGPDLSTDEVAGAVVNQLRQTVWYAHLMAYIDA
jgi:shikimate kinase